MGKLKGLQLRDELWDSGYRGLVALGLGMCGLVFQVWVWPSWVYPAAWRALCLRKSCTNLEPLDPCCSISETNRKT